MSKLNQDSGSVVSLQDFRMKKQLRAERRSSVVDSFAPQGRSQYSQPRQDKDLAKRIERIKGSINRINNLMNELRGLNNPNKSTPKT